MIGFILLNHGIIFYETVMCCLYVKISDKCTILMVSFKMCLLVFSIFVNA